MCWGSWLLQAEETSSEGNHSIQLGRESILLVMIKTGMEKMLRPTETSAMCHMKTERPTFNGHGLFVNKYCFGGSEVTYGLGLNSVH